MNPIAKEYSTLPEYPYSEFLANYQGPVDGLVEIFTVDISLGKVMCIPGVDGCVYITREQAKKFFKLRN